LLELFIFKSSNSLLDLGVLATYEVFGDLVLLLDSGRSDDVSRFFADL